MRSSRLQSSAPADEVAQVQLHQIAQVAGPGARAIHASRYRRPFVIALWAGLSSCSLAMLRTLAACWENIEAAPQLTSSPVGPP